ncbi:hypothetical protein BYT27DRAFT_6896808 [Phlegmacium glaucopus]|nr:hypothetical protein BYT27DRAFT_6896808 [Phlegmacium glaucopus]
MLLRSNSVGVVSGSLYSVPVLSLVSGSTPPTSNSETSPYHSDSSEDTPNPLPHLCDNNYFFVITFPLSVSTPAMDYSPQECRTFREQNAALYIYLLYFGCYSFYYLSTRNLYVFLSSNINLVSSSYSSSKFPQLLVPLCSVLTLKLGCEGLG